MMALNWPIIGFVFFISVPGTYIAIPRLMNLLLPNNSATLKKRFSRFVIMQTLFMVLLMSIAGSALSLKTGLNDPILDALLQKQPVLNSVLAMLLPFFLYSLAGILIFFFFYYSIVTSLLDEASLVTLKKMRLALGLDGCLLYGGVVEEVLARWGLMNVIAFFIFLLIGQKDSLLMWCTILVSGLLYTMSHLPAYIAAGCQNNRRFRYSMLLLNSWQAIFFGWIFWQYGLLAAIISHSLLHLVWYFYDRDSA